MGSEVMTKQDLCNLAVKAEVTEAATSNGATADPYPAKPKHTPSQL
jgi:hypothetical protein